MEIRIKYGGSTASCQLPDRIQTTVLHPAPGDPLPSFEESLTASLRTPIDSPALLTNADTSSRITVVIPDKTRQCILDRILPVLLSYIEDRGIPSENITLLFANGTHEPQSDDEIGRILGERVYGRYRTEQHIAADDGSLEDLTTTSRGTKVRINRLILQSDLVLTVGGILHHYFAGFGGGPKLLVPGVAGYETARQNHRYTIAETGAFDPRCRNGSLDENPVYLDIVEAVRAIPNVFSVNIVLDSQNNPAGFYCGNIIAAHRKGAEHAVRLYEVPIEKKADLVIVSPGGSPRDGTFIQSHKAIHHAYSAVKPGGTILAAAACGDGIGSATFMRWFSIPYDSLGAELLSSYSLNGHTALSLRTKLNSVAMGLVSELDSVTVSRMGIRPYPTLQSAVDDFVSAAHSPAMVHVLPHGALTVPVFHD
jgi:lactate racemase